MKKQKKKKEQADFGYRKVDAVKKAGLVDEVFSSVANRYDLMNDLMSGGLHRLWKDKFVGGITLKKGTNILDMAGGTGDIAFRILEKAKKQRASINITISDINEEMLGQGRVRAIDRGIVEGVEWQQADAEKLPFKKDSFDCYTIAFGIRNVTHIDKALKEAFRVLKPGGHFYCLEFSNVNNPLLKKIYDVYSFEMIPRIGRAVTGNKDAYQYLVESIRKFPDRDRFTQMIEKAGFAKVHSKSLTKGVVAIHTGVKE